MNVAPYPSGWIVRYGAGYSVLMKSRAFARAFAKAVGGTVGALYEVEIRKAVAR